MPKLMLIAQRSVVAVQHCILVTKWFEVYRFDQVLFGPDLGLRGFELLRLPGAQQSLAFPPFIEVVVTSCPMMGCNGGVSLPSCVRQGQG